MRPRLVPALVLAALTLLPALPAQAAFHGVEWKASGVATKDNLPYTIDIVWGGIYSGTSVNVFTVTVKDATGAVAASADFLGYENFNANEGGSYWELLSMIGGSRDPSVHFSISGTQMAFIQSRDLYQVLSGTFQDYSFNVASVNYVYHF
jgi:hypothetical protein